MDNLQSIQNLINQYFNPHGGLQLFLQPYAYVLDFRQLASSASASGQINIAANANFVLTNPRFACFENGNAVAIPDVSIQLMDTGSQQLFSSNFVNIATYFGVPTAANDVGILPFPRVIGGRSGLGVQVVNNGANAVDLHLAFHGIQVYTLSGQ